MNQFNYSDVFFSKNEYQVSKKKKKKLKIKLANN